MEKQSKLNQDCDPILFFTTGAERRSVNHHNDEADIESEMELLK